MKLKIEQLHSHLQQGLAPVYFLSGDEPLQLGESTDAIRAAARGQGFSDRLVMHVEPGFDWSSLYAEANTLSLFAERRILELRLNNYKLGEAGGKALLTYLEKPSPDNVLIISGPRLDATAKRAKWHKQLEKQAVNLQVWPIETRQLPGWVAHRVKSKGFRITPEAVRLLAERVEGNLLAAAQDIEKLALLYPDQQWDVELVMDAVADSAHYDVFGLVDSALLGDRKRYVHMLDHLHAAGTEPTLVLWALGEQCRKLYKVAQQRASGRPLEQIFKDMHIWYKQQPPVRAAAERFKPMHWMRFLRRAGQVDRIIKGQQTGNPWDELLKLGLAISGTELLRAK